MKSTDKEPLQDMLEKGSRRKEIFFSERFNFILFVLSNQKNNLSKKRKT